MGIFGHDYYSQPRPAPEPVTVTEAKPRASAGLLVPCDGCHATHAKVEVITEAGSVFLCQHHHRKHRDSIVAAGHLIRQRLWH